MLTRWWLSVGICVSRLLKPVCAPDGASANLMIVTIAVVIDFDLSK